VPRSAYYLFLTTVTINSLVSVCHIFFVLYATKVANITESQYATALAISFLGIAIPALLAGFRMDVTGRKRFLVIGYLLYIPAMLLFVIGDFYMLLAGLFLYLLGNLLRVNSSQVLLGDLVPRELRGKAVGFLQFFLYLVQAFIYLLGGFLYEFINPQLPFLLLAATAAPLALLIVFKISEPKIKEI